MSPPSRMSPSRNGNPTEATPLLSKQSSTIRPSTPTLTPVVPGSTSLISPFRRLLLAALLQSLSFVSTATPILYAFRTMSCQVYYEHHPDPTFLSLGDEMMIGDRCARKEIDAETAKAISLMVTLTTLSGLLNLFTTGWIIRRNGVKLAMTLQTLIPCFRNMCQIYGIYHGGLLGIRMIQWTQLLTIFGGGGGYMLTANSYSAASVTPEERTASFGILQGFLMLGTALGYTIGGLMDDWFGAAAPFELTLGLLVLSTLLSIFFLPYIPPDEQTTKSSSSSSSSSGLLAPLKVFWPRSILLNNGKTIRYWGLTWLAVGSFIGVFATAFVPMALQLVATNKFGFGPKKNGYLLSLAATSRAAFLTLAFPRIIAAGRNHLSPPSTNAKSPPAKPTTILPTEPETLEPLSANPDELSEPAPILVERRSTGAKQDIKGSRFDLIFLRTSMVVDSLLTGCVVFASQGQHIYLAALILPLASGTAPAAKGVIMELVPSSQQSIALQSIALVESLAMVSTVSVLGIVFAILSEQGKGGDIFGINAMIAFVAAIVLMGVGIPPKEGEDEVPNGEP